MRNLRTEDEIIANWKGDIEKPVVSICCITYNHEPYIEDALEGFLIQETDFPFEILIHDDASTDRTADIIREYEAKYPRLIKPIYQSENQYSKTINQSINGQFNIPRALGESLAFCEGDDYWLSKNKMQIQLQIMKEKKVDFVFHSSISKSIEGEIVNSCYTESGFVSLKDHLLKGPQCSPLSSIMIKKQNLNDLDKLVENFTRERLTHTFLQYCGFLNGDAYYINKEFSIYRLALPGSWTERVRGSQKLFIANTIRHIDSLAIFKNKVFVDRKSYFYLRILKILVKVILAKNLGFKEKIGILMLFNNWI